MASNFLAGPLGQLLPLLFWGLIWGVVIFFIAKKRRDNPWLWAVLCAIPVAGWLITMVYFLLTLHSILDRLNRLEANKTFD